LEARLAKQLGGRDDRRVRERPLDHFDGLPVDLALALATVGQDAPGEPWNADGPPLEADLAQPVDDDSAARPPGRGANVGKPVRRRPNTTARQPGRRLVLQRE